MADINYIFKKSYVEVVYTNTYEAHSKIVRKIEQDDYMFGTGLCTFIDEVGSDVGDLVMVENKDGKLCAATVVAVHDTNKSPLPDNQLAYTVMGMQACDLRAQRESRENRAVALRRLDEMVAQYNRLAVYEAVAKAMPEAQALLDIVRGHRPAERNMSTHGLGSLNVFKSGEFKTGSLDRQVVKEAMHGMVYGGLNPSGLFSSETNLSGASNRNDDIDDNGPHF